MTIEDGQKAPASTRRAHRDAGFEAAFGARIRSARVAANLTQAALGEAAGISFQQVQKYELGKDRIAVGTLQALAKALGVDPGSFFDNWSPVESDTTVSIREAHRIGSRVLAIKDPHLIQRVMSLVDELAKTDGNPRTDDARE